MKIQMREIYLVVLTLLLTAGLLPGQQTGPEWAPPPREWEEFRSAEGGFRILVPGPVRQSADTLETGIGQLVYHTFFCQEKEEDGSDNLLYMVSYVDYPAGTVHSDSTELLPEFFEATVESAAFSINGKVLYAHEDRYFEYPGYIWRIDYLGGKAVIKTRAYLVGSRLYTLQTVTYRELNLNPASDKFMEAFRLLDR